MTPKEPVSLCRFCKSPFAPRDPLVSGGSKQEFCSANHRKLFHKYGGQTFVKQVDRIRREVLVAIRKELPDLIEHAMRQRNL